jgi:hypothetical protein
VCSGASSDVPVAAACCGSSREAELVVDAA